MIKMTYVCDKCGAEITGSGVQIDEFDRIDALGVHGGSQTRHLCPGCAGMMTEWLMRETAVPVSSGMSKEEIEAFLGGADDEADDGLVGEIVTPAGAQDVKDLIDALDSEVSAGPEPDDREVTMIRDEDGNLVEPCALGEPGKSQKKKTRGKTKES